MPMKRVNYFVPSAACENASFKDTFLLNVFFIHVTLKVKCQTKGAHRLTCSVRTLFAFGFVVRFNLKCISKIHMHPIRASKLDWVLIGLPLSEQLLKSFQSGHFAELELESLTSAGSPYLNYRSCCCQPGSGLVIVNVILQMRSIKHIVSELFVSKVSWGILVLTRATEANNN